MSAAAPDNGIAVSDKSGIELLVAVGEAVSAMLIAVVEPLEVVTENEGLEDSLIAVEDTKSELRKALALMFCEVLDKIGVKFEWEADSADAAYVLSKGEMTSDELFDKLEPTLIVCEAEEAGIPLAKGDMLDAEFDRRLVLTVSKTVLDKTPVEGRGIKLLSVVEDREVRLPGETLRSAVDIESTEDLSNILEPVDAPELGSNEAPLAAELPVGVGEEAEESERRLPLAPRGEAKDLEFMSEGGATSEAERVSPYAPVDELDGADGTLIDEVREAALLPAVETEAPETLKAVLDVCALVLDA